MRATIKLNLAALKEINDLLVMVRFFGDVSNDKILKTSMPALKGLNINNPGCIPGNYKQIYATPQELNI